jgi:hypothetical protein
VLRPWPPIRRTVGGRLAAHGDRHETEAPARRDGPGCATIARVEDGPHRNRRPGPLRDLSQRPDDGAHHLVEEPVALHVEMESRPVRLPANDVQGADRAAAGRRAVVGEAAEVVSPLQRGGGGGERGERRRRVDAPCEALVERTLATRDEQRVPVPLPDRVPLGVEVSRRLAHVDDAHVVGQHGVQRACQLGRVHRVLGAQRGDRLACMHAGIGPTAADHGVRRAQDARERRLDLALHGARVRLALPSLEAGSVVGEVEAQDTRPGHARLRPRRGAVARREC